MRPLRLKMEAFGPFVKPMELDFERELGNDNFFLIHGVTGAGKTTILDAICFALYGSSSGGGRDGSMMRSKHAKDNQTTYVEFEFALKEKKYRVRRTPKYEKPKTRGTGSTVINADAELYELDDALSVLLTNGALKVTAAVEELIGFKCEQFRQVIMLPQGDFTRFLQAGSKERELILSILFKTGFYRRLEELLKKRAADKKRAYELKLREQEIYLTEAGAANPDELTKIILEVDGELMAAQDKIKRLKTEKDALNKKFAEAQALSKMFSELERKTVELKGAAAELARVRKELEAARVEYEKRKAEEPERRKMDQRIIELTKVINKLEELKAAIKRSAAAAKSVEEAQKNLSTVKTKVEKYEQRLQQLLDEEKRHITSAGKVEESKRRLADCKLRDQLVETINRLEGDLKQMSDIAGDAQKLCGDISKKNKALNDATKLYDKKNNIKEDKDLKKYMELQLKAKK